MYCLLKTTLTEVVVVFWLSRVTDLFDVNVGGSGWDTHHCIIPWKKQDTEGDTIKKKSLKRQPGIDNKSRE